MRTDKKNFHSFCQFCISVFARFSLSTIHVGIAGYKNGLIVSNFRVGGLYWVNPQTQQTTELVQREELPMPTGLVVDNENNRVYVTSSYPYSVSVWKLKMNNRNKKHVGVGDDDETDHRPPRASYKGAIVSELLDDPRSITLLEGYLYCVNSKAKSTGLPAQDENQPWFNEEFNMVEVGI